MAHHYIAGPWEWDDTAGAESGYRAPAGCTALVDLRTIPQQSAPQHTNGLGNGFFCLPDDQPVPSGYTLLGTGDLREINTSQQSRSAWQSMYGVTPQGDHLVDYLAYTLTDGSDPEGATAPKPLDMCPETGDILLAGHSVVWSSPLDVRGSNARWALMLRDRIRKDLQRQAEQDGDVQWRKTLATIKWKYGRQRWNDPDGEEIWLTPQMRARGKRGAIYAIEPATTYTESWPTNGAITSGQDRTWTYITGSGSTLTVANNRLKTSGINLSTDYARMNSALSGTDVYAQTQLKAWGSTAEWGLITRKDSNDSTATFYFYYVYSGEALEPSYHYIYKRVTGTSTWLTNSGSVSHVVDDICKAEANGSALKTYRNGVQAASVTDTAITSGTYCGEYKKGGGANGIGQRETDSWECGDIGGGGGGGGMGFNSGAIFSGRVLGGRCIS